MIEINNRAHGFLVAAEAGTIFNPTVDQVISWSDESGLRAGVLYQGYSGASVECHIAGWGPNWLRKDFLWVIFDYPFAQLQCKMIMIRIPYRNSKSLAFCGKLGFKEKVRIEEVFPDCDLSVMIMRREDCRWLDFSCGAKRLMSQKGSAGGQEIQSSEAAEL